MTVMHHGNEFTNTDIHLKLVKKNVPIFKMRHSIEIKASLVLTKKNCTDQLFYENYKYQETTKCLHGKHLKSTEC